MAEPGVAMKRVCIVSIIVLAAAFTSVGTAQEFGQLERLDSGDLEKILSEHEGEVKILEANAAELEKAGKFEELEALLAAQLSQIDSEGAVDAESRDRAVELLMKLGALYEGEKSEELNDPVQAKAAYERAKTYLDDAPASVAAKWEKELAAGLERVSKMLEKGGVVPDGEGGIVVEGGGGGAKIIVIE